MSEAITQHFRPSEDVRENSLAADVLQRVEEIRVRIAGMGSKSGALGAVGLHALRQLETGEKSFNDFTPR